MPQSLTELLSDDRNVSRETVRTGANAVRMELQRDQALKGAHREQEIPVGDARGATMTIGHRG